MTTGEYKVGDRVRLKCDLPVAPAGTVGTVQRFIYDEQRHVTAIEILIDFGDGDLRGTTLFPDEIERV
jgi:hypothetical protein